jgi:hypothetical protein
MLTLFSFSSTDSLAGHYRQSSYTQRPAAFSTPPTSASTSTSTSSSTTRQSYSVNAPQKNVSKVVVVKAEEHPLSSSHLRVKLTSETRPTKFTRVPPPKYRPHPPLISQKRQVASTTTTTSQTTPTFQVKNKQNSKQHLTIFFKVLLE